MLTLSGCPQVIEPPVVLLPARTSGAMLLSHGDYVYFLGGMLEDGTLSSKTYVASIKDASEGELSWVETTPMPSGRAFGVALAVGNALYVIGGSNTTGPVSTIYYTSISSSDGTLGFSGTPRFWEVNPNPLPNGLSHMSHVLYDGRVFLIGGNTQDGVSDSIIHARIWQKGMIGMWYEGTQALPSKRSQTSAAVWFDDTDTQSPYLVIAGGIDENGNVLEKTVVFSIGRYGKLTATGVTAPIPKALASPILISDATGLSIAGGLDSNLQTSKTVYRNSSPFDSWTVTADEILAQGPSFGRGNRSIWYLSQEQEGPAGITSWQPENYHPSVPIIGPGSGTVQYNTTVTHKSEAGSSILFSKEEGIWNDIASLGKITESQTIKFKSSSSETLIDSPIIVRDYTIHALEFLVHVSGSIALTNQTGTYDTFYMTDDIRNESATGRAIVRAQFRIFEPTAVVIDWKDASFTDPGPYSARIAFSLYEEDLLSEAIDALGNPIVDVSGGTALPVEATLQAGTYYFEFEDIDDIPGRSFGLSVYARE
jgi:hypothetical protein